MRDKGFRKNNKHFIFILLLILLLGGLLAVPFNAFSYTDEIVAVICALFVTGKFLRRALSKECKVLFEFLILIELIGIISGFFSDIHQGFYQELMDAFLLIKPYVIFIFFCSISDASKEYALKKMKSLSKIIIIIMFILAILTQIVDTGMAIHSELLFGLKIKVFGFIFHNGIQTVWLVLSCFIIICYNEKGEKKYRLYFAIYLLTLLCIFGGFGAILLCLSIVFTYIFRDKKDKKLKVWQLIPLVVIILFVSYGDIQGYLFNQSAPRALLIRYGFETAKDYFPLGSGFATYGSEMAARYYSPLYYRYGFNTIWSMSGGNSGQSTLKDVYIGMILGQFGFIGCFAFLIFLYHFFIILNKNTTDNRVKPICLAAFFTICSTMIVSSNSTTIIGPFVFAALGISSRSYLLSNDHFRDFKGVKIER